MNDSTDLTNLGPLEVIYHGADQVLANAQGLLGAARISDFVASVRWNEPFIRALIVGQIVLFAITYATRTREVLQFGILLLLTAITLMAERLNNYGRSHWSQFATQDYFDGPGLFMMVFVSGPFVVLANFIVIGMGMRLVRLYQKRLRRQNHLRQTQSGRTIVGGDEKKNS